MTENEKLDLILADMQSMKHDMADMKHDMEGMKHDTEGVKHDMEGMKHDMEGMKHDMEGVKQDIADMKQDINDVNQRVTKLDMILDNEIRVNIQRVAEGHLDLSRNLHDAMRPSNEQEMLAIKVRMLESDVKDLKARFA